MSGRVKLMQQEKLLLLINLKNMSSKFSLDKEDALHALKVLGYSSSSALVSFLIAIIPVIHVPPEYAAVMGALVPIVNTILVAIKRFLTDKTK